MDANTLPDPGSGTNPTGDALSSDGIPWNDTPTIGEILQSHPFDRFRPPDPTPEELERQEREREERRRQEQEAAEKREKEDERKRLEDERKRLEMEEWEKQQRRDRAFSEFFGSVGPRYRDCRIGNFEITTDEQQKVVEALKRYGKNMAAEVEAGNGIVLFGPSGTGKDHLLAALGAHAIHLGLGEPDVCDLQRGEYFNRGVLWQNALDFYGKLRDSMDNKHQTEGGIIEGLVSPAILILSDPLPPTGALTEFQAGALLRVIDARYRQCRATWATLNVSSGAEADERMGSPIVDRLRDGALTFKCDWPSYRKARKEE